MTKTPAPLLGFNNNVRHRGRIFHIQTEDSGVKSPRIVTHLFADGGRIVKTTRTDYAEHVGQKDMAPVVRKLMKEQHKAMFISLRAGELDQLLEQVCGPLPPETASLPPAQAVSDPAVAEAPSPSKVQAYPAPAKQATAPIGSIAVLPSGQPAGTADHTDTLANPLLRRVAAPAPPVAEEQFDLAVGAPTPAAPAVVASAAAGTQPTEPRKVTPPPLPRRQPSNPGLTSIAAVSAASAPASPKGRYAAPRPSAIFTQNEPDKQTIFGESVISEQSLDEVILSYLAEDLEAK